MSAVEAIFPTPTCPIEADLEEHCYPTPSCTICHEVGTIVSCSGSLRHDFCQHCFQGYIRSSMGLNGEYQRELSRNGIISSPGCLPCPHFLSGGCSCDAIKPSVIRHCVNDELFDLWRQADIRVGMARLELEQEKTKAHERDIQEQFTEIGNLKHSVIEALTRGVTVCCPQCKTKGEKDDKCMHIRCQSCDSEWCYCCGRRRGSNGTRDICSREHGCDSTSPFLESQPGWENFSLKHENPGEGALHEFHRRRMAYFLKQVKQTTDSSLWAELRTEFPTLLIDTPTAGRKIDWDEIDNAEIPTFGETKPVDVAWSEEGREILADLETRRKIILDKQEEIELCCNRNTILQRHFAKTLSTGISMSTWIFILFNILLFTGLICAITAIPNSLIKGILILILNLYLSLLIISCTIAAIDWRYSILINERDEWALPYAEIQFCGSRAEVPYLSRKGRWREYRILYLSLLTFSVAFGLSLTLCDHIIFPATYNKVYGLSGLGPALLAFAAMIFGLGTIIINISPPPDVAAYRYSFYRGIITRFFICGGVFFPIGVYLMAGFIDHSHLSYLWMIGCILVGIAIIFISSDLSNRCLNTRGFTLDRIPLVSNRRHAMFWSFVVVGIFLLGTSEMKYPRMLAGFIMIFAPFVAVIISKVYSSLRS
jgi:hypothetical protein